MIILSGYLENKFCTLIIIWLVWCKTFPQELKLMKRRILVLSWLNKAQKSIYPTLTIKKKKSGELQNHNFS